MEAPGLTPPPFYQIASKCVNQWGNSSQTEKREIRRGNDNCTHTSLDCGMPKWVVFYFSANQISVLSVVKLHASAGSGGLLKIYLT